MPASSLTSSSSAEPEDSDDDLDDVPLSFARDSASRYADDPPPTSRGTPLGFAARGLPPAFKLNLGTPPGGAAASSRGGAASPFADGLEEMRSEPVSLPSSRAGGPPKLSLNLAGVRATSLSGKDVAAAAEDDGFAVPPPTQRGTPFKPPRLNLSNPASASPVASGGMQMLPPRQDGAPSAMPAAAQQQHAATPSIASSHAASRSGPVHVELISAAFVLQDAQRHASQQLEPEPAGPSDRIRARCSQQLGVAADQIELYELRPLPANGGQLPDGCSNVGVRIQGATFSLSALEDLIARSRQDSQLAATLDRAQQAVLGQAERLAKLEGERGALQERLKAAEQENQHLRDQLHRSDEHRHAMGDTIRTLRREFEGVKQKLAEADPQLLPALAGLSLSSAGGTPSRG